MSGLDPAVRMRLRERRVYLGLSQQQVAARLGVSWSVVADLEGGQAEVLPSMVSLWAELLGLRMKVGWALLPGAKP